ncbi:hypothetical protein [Mycolicibacterium komossense]|uniref:Uncharacterized protein n=1 Tax=Mycolicibacterium komossense TaxID=1779 RepID=A0ABT3C917_9MYCO|nr:hypothetical protein [Mycolicibacterium komossense]MCV7225973.1 hypothetical protein [Mycolicibacterium komossense]
MTRTKNSRTKLLAAVIGGGALVAMGLFTAIVDDAPVSTAPSSVAGQMTEGVTVTETTPATTLAIAKAVPAVKATAYK